MTTPFEEGDIGMFDEIKYKSLLDSLEISEVNLSYVLSNNKVFRFDSSYYKKSYLFDENLIRDKENNKLKYLVDRLVSFGAYSLNNFISYTETGIPFIRGINMKKGTVDFSQMIYIDSKANNLLWKPKVTPETILLSMSGTLGDVAIASKHWNYPINSNQDIAKITCNNKINPYYLYCFLLSKFGQNYIKREARGSVQQHVFLSQIESFEIPIFKNTFQEKIQDYIELSENYNLNSQKAYHHAETVLLLTLGLKSFKPSKEKVNIKNFSDSFSQSGRLDAEYYQAKYDELFSIIQKQKYELLGNLASIKKSIEPGSMFYDDTGIPFLRVADYNKFGITQPHKYLSFQYIETNKQLLERLKPKTKTILFSKDGSVGNAYMLEKDEDLITSGAILHLRVKNENIVLPQFLTLVLNSIVVKMQAERDSGGSIILHWKPSEIEKVLVPVLDIEIQKQISDRITESFRLKKQSEQLLEIAKTAVEMAIEKNEDEAMEWMEEKIKTIDSFSFLLSN